MDVSNLEDALEMGAWLGRKQAFSGVAGRCSAADAHCLLVLREQKKYKAFGLSWEAFCTERLGISRALADKTIRHFVEFGETYFYLTGLVPMAPEDYRLIAGAVSAEGVEHAGERIAIAPQNAVRLAGAIKNLKQQARLALPAPAAKPAPANMPTTPVWRAAQCLRDSIAELEQLLSGGAGQLDRATLQLVLVGSHERLGRLNRGLRL
jgi:hypothetical protein